MKKAVKNLLAGFVLLLVGLLPGGSVTAQESRQLTREKPAEKRFALVIGNGSYKVSPVSTAANDANEIASALRAAGFEVVLVTDSSQKEMLRAINGFGEKLRNDGGTGLFYFSGHGIQTNGKGFLVPIGALIEGEEDINFETVAVGRVIKTMESARNRTNIIILDASQGKPFSAKFPSNRNGLAPVRAPAGIIVAYSASPGMVAMEPEGKFGLYTNELVKQIRTPGQNILEVFEKTKTGVKARSSEQQIPWDSSALTWQFYFNSDGESVAINAPEKTPAVSNPVRSRKPKVSPKEQAAWDLVKDSSDISVLQVYLDEFPNGAFASVARIKVKRVQRDEWEEANASNDAREIRKYLAKYPKGEFAPIGRIKLKQMEKSLWKEISESDASGDYERYLENHPDGENAETAKSKVKQIEKDAWNDVRDSDDPEEIKTYLEKYPNAVYAEQAESRIRQIERDLWENARSSRDVGQVEIYLSKYPEGQYAAEARELVEELKIVAAPQKKESTFARFLDRIVTVQSACKPNAYQIALYFHAKYQGRCVIRGIGRYSSSRAIGLPDNSISSVIVGSKVRAGLCRNPNFGGRCETFNRSRGNLVGSKVGNDKVSSVIVQRYTNPLSVGTAPPGPPSKEYRFCAKENDKCAFSGKRTVAYGANGRFKYKYNVKKSIRCNNRKFGDPIPGTAKACYIKE